MRHSDGSGMTPSLQITERPHVPRGWKRYPWTFQDGPDDHHLGLTWSYFKATNLELQIQIQKTETFKASKRHVK